MSSKLKQIAVIDDDRDFSQSLVELLEGEGYSVSAFYDANLALAKINADFEGVVLLDIRMPTLSGDKVLLKLMEIDSMLPVIHVTGHGDIPMAVSALKQGAYGFFTKPLNIDELLRDLGNALKTRHTELARRQLKQQLSVRDDLAQTLVGAAPSMVQLRQTIAKVGSTNVDVLISGETGTGKEVVAGALVQTSSRSNRPFIAINCGHLSHAQATEELFGVETLLPSGDTNIRSGHFERANGGTLLLDEIESMPIDMQARLLRVLQERTLQRINGEGSVPLDVRILVTTKTKLDKLVTQGSFREDLYYRLSGLEIALPPLRDRGTDALMLFMNFLHNSGHSVELSPGLMSDILSHDWPGNVRELANAAERFASGLTVFSAHEMPRKDSLAVRVAQFEKGMIEAALTYNKGSLKGAMLDLDIPRKTLYDKMTRHGINKDDFVSEDH